MIKDDAQNKDTFKERVLKVENTEIIEIEVGGEGMIIAIEKEKKKSKTRQKDWKLFAAATFGIAILTAGLYFLTREEE